jgi:type III restriction enzyme
LRLTIKNEYVGVDHDYEPDFLVRLSNDTMVILEIKGDEVRDPRQVNSKHNAAKKWVRAVNNLGDFCRWESLVDLPPAVIPRVMVLARPPRP